MSKLALEKNAVVSVNFKNESLYIFNINLNDVLPAMLNYNPISLQLVKFLAIFSIFGENLAFLEKCWPILSDFKNILIFFWLKFNYDNFW